MEFSNEAEKEKILKQIQRIIREYNATLRPYRSITGVNRNVFVIIWVCTLLSGLLYDFWNLVVSLDTFIANFFKLFWISFGMSFIVLLLHNNKFLRSGRSIFFFCVVVWLFGGLVAFLLNNYP